MPMRTGHSRAEKRTFVANRLALNAFGSANFSCFVNDCIVSVQPLI
jgi:hypothetical protein